MQAFFLSRSDYVKYEMVYANLLSLDYIINYDFIFNFNFRFFRRLHSKLTRVE